VAIIGFFLGILVLAILAQARIPDGPATAARPDQVQVTAQPSTTAAPSAEPPAPAAPAQPPHEQPGAPATKHTVALGETLAGIALRHQVPLEQIAAANGIADPNRVQAGRHLVIGPAKPGLKVIEPGATLSGYAQQLGHSVADLMVLNPHLSDPDQIMAGAGLRVAAK